ncbi:class II fructose-bisphosphatase [Nocardioides sp. AN3]
MSNAKLAPGHAPSADLLTPLDWSLAFELVRVTQGAAAAASSWVGRGSKNDADAAAVTTMRRLLRSVPVNGTVVIGEGEKDDAPMLFNGEQVGQLSATTSCDVAVDPIDGTRLTANGLGGALSVLAVAEPGAMYDPSAVFYMDKLVTDADAASYVDLTRPVSDNVRAVARAKGRSAPEITVAVLDRPRHEDLVAELRATGARVALLSDGDVAGAIAAATPGSPIDLLVGAGGTPEGVLAACAIRTLGGVIQGRLRPRDNTERRKALEAGHDLDLVLSTEDLVSGRDVIFVATGVTDGDLLRGPRSSLSHVTTHSVVMQSRDRTIDFVESTAPLEVFSRCTEQPVGED